MTNINGLIHCPLCGDIEEYNPSISKSFKYKYPGTQDTELIRDGYYIECDKCACMGPTQSTEEQAAAKWNTRIKPFNSCEICDTPDLCAAGKTPCCLSSEFAADVPAEVANKLLLQVNHAKPEYANLTDFIEAIKWVDSLAWQRENNAVVCLDLRDVKALRTLLSAFMFQSRVHDWMRQCFTPAIIADKLERCDRFIEEALELVQACAYSAERAHALVDYVFGRPVGEAAQETGGVMVTLAALCTPHGIAMAAAGEKELARVWTKIADIRAKQATKPVGSALPQ